MTDATLPDAARAQLEHLPCPNCGDPTPGPFCPRCGQRRVERRVSLRRMLAEVVEDQLSLNAALPRTLVALLFQPGRLSAEYMGGRIARYIPPFRLYLVTSVVFFLLLSITSGRDPIFEWDSDSDRVQPDSAAGGGAPGDSAAGAAAVTPADSASPYLWGENMTVSSFWPVLDTLLEERFDHFRRMPPEQAADAISSEIVRRAPTAMFLLLPIFAFLLKILYIRRARFYVEHFVFALHAHAFVFLLFTIMLVASSPYIIVPALIWLVLYLYFAMLRFYRQGWFRTLLKYGILVNAYLIVFTFGIVGLLVAAILLA